VKSSVGRQKEGLQAPEGIGTGFISMEEEERGDRN